MSRLFSLRISAPSAAGLSPGLSAGLAARLSAHPAAGLSPELAAHGPAHHLIGEAVNLRPVYNHRAAGQAAVSVIIDLPDYKGTAEERAAELKRVAAIKPTEPVLGTCDLIVKNEKGKEETKYNIVSDCIGALDALWQAGVKKYRIVYCMKKLNTPASYAMTAPAEKGKDLEELSEKERMNQLI